MKQYALHWEPKDMDEVYEDIYEMFTKTESVGADALIIYTKNIEELHK